MRRTLAILVAMIATITGVGGAWAAGPSRNLDDYTLLGIDRVHLKDLATVTSGNIGVNEPAGIALVVGRGSVFATGTTVVADSMRGDRITLFDLYANRLLTPVTSLTINGVGPQPTGALPLIAPLPTLPVFAPGTGSFVAAGNLTLPPGAYGNVVVQSGMTLTLSGGTYEMRALQTARNGRIVVTGPVVINIKGTLRLGNGSFFGALAPVTPEQVVVNLGGTVGRFGAGSAATITLFGPNARLAFGRNFIGIGQFIGGSINTDHSTTFSREVCGNAIVEAHEDCDPPDGVVCDATCHFIAPATTTSSTTTTTSTTSSSSSTSSTAPTTSTSSSMTTTTSSSTSTTAPTTTTSSSTSTTSTAPTTTTSSSSSTSSTSTSSSSTAPTTTSTSTSTTSTAPTTTTSSSSTTSSTSTSTSSTAPTTTTSTSTSTTSTAPTTTTSSSTTSTSTSTTSTAPTIPNPTTTTTSSTVPVAICGNNELEDGEECDPPGSTCPPDGICMDDCVCLFGGSS
ncbi:MAG TPA: hypothetical protein VGR62_10780 [Candidatus Binatia bacterium]|nr:hypothetical protein [Candidatus Binatia bacterium]